MSEPNRCLEEVLFEAALARTSAAERAAFLEAVCRGNPDLRARLGVLLEGHFHAEGFLPAGPVPAASQPLRGFEWRYLRALLRGDELACLGTNDTTVVSVAVSPDGKTLATIGQTGETWIFDLKSRKVITKLPYSDAALSSVAFSPDGTVLAIGTSRRSSLWNTKAWQWLRDLPCGHNPQLVFSPAGRWLACGSRERWPSAEGDSAVFDYQTGARAASFPGAGGQVAFSSDGRWLAMGPSNQVVTVVDWLTGQTVASLRPSGDLWAMAFSPDGQDLVTTCWYESVLEAGVLEVWNLRRQQRLTTLHEHRAQIWSIAFSPDGQTMATASSDQTVRLWDVATWQTREILRGHGNVVWAVVFTPDGQQLVTGGSYDPVMLWPVHPARLPETIEKAYSQPVFSPDGALFATLSATNQLTLFAAATATPAGTIKGAYLPLGFLPNSRTLVTLREDAVLTRWDADTCSRLSETRLVGAKGLSCFHLSPDGTTLLAGGRIAHSQEVDTQIWDARSGSRRATLPEHFFPDAASFSPDGRWLATVLWEDILLWDARTFEKVAKLHEQPMLITCTAFSWDSRTLAAGTAYGTIVLWDMALKKPTATLGRHTEGLEDISFSPDGKTIAAFSHGNVILWNLATQREVARFAIEGTPTFSPDGRLLVLHTPEDSLRLLRAPSFAELEAAERRLYSSP